MRTAVLVALLAALILPARGIRGADTLALNVLLIPADSSAEVYYAQDLGFFKDAGLDVKLAPMASSPAIVAALASGAADIGNSVVGSAAAARARGIGVRFIAPAGLYLATTPTSKLMIAKDSPLKTASDLTGKTVAVSGLADLTYFAAREWIDKTGGNSANVKFVELPIPAMAPALAQHRVDAAVLIEPFITAASGDLKPFANVDDYVAKRFLATGWLASDAWLQTHADAALRFAAVMRRTAAWANAHHRESAAILLRYTKISPDVASTMTRATYGTSLEPSLMQPVIDDAAKYGAVPRSVSVDDLIWAPSK